MTVSTERVSKFFRSDPEAEAEGHHGRTASLSEVERAVLIALFIDLPQMQASSLSDSTCQRRFLNDEMLFSIPQGLSDDTANDKRAENQPNSGLPKQPVVKKNPKDYRLHVGLWQAHEDGVTPKVLSRMASVVSSTKQEGESTAGMDKMESFQFSAETDGSEDIADSSMRILPGSQSSISWDENEDSIDHFDAWQVLKDEYAQEKGFDYRPVGPYVDDSDTSHHQFKIIGTSADDKSSHPHVMSPPLLDSIMTYLPDHLHDQNYWMKYSLIRDGASLDTFKAYVRGAKDIILAIETTRGDVFGVYTSSPWRTSPTLYGGAPSFVWKMRYNRNSPCHSLIEQATLESEIDAYPIIEQGIHFQICTHDKIGVGVGNMNRYDSLGNVQESEHEVEQRNGKNFGFAVCLEDDLLSGTTSRSSCYRSPCLVDARSNGEPFEVLNLEAWTLTPAFSEESAEKLEMTHYFVSESIRSTARSVQSISSNETFSSRDLDRHSFYRRIGHDDSHEELRDQWQLRRMMDGDGVGSRGIGASPRFSK
ncbi:TLD domain containing protein [Nitzschia inconspicua]|uniref:Oxidation resistance protein 1 n=1 Tax=Nitzschia inconspicua TaxID=303405 RepID=A0A9K3PU06_9STRA|nr:TLD domain containing protein [Nitzschia inconspicua]